MLFDWFLMEKMSIAKEILNMLDLGQKAIASNFSWVFCIENTKITMDKCSHCAMALDYSFRWLSTAPSHRMVALWVHPFTLHQPRHAIITVYVSNIVEFHWV